MQSKRERDAGWFQGDKPRSEDEARFLARLRGLAADWTASGLLPAGTGCLTALTPLLVTVEHPLLREGSGLTELQVGYWPPSASGIRLQGEWGNEYLLDNEGDPTDLRVEGVSAEPEFFAETAASWLEAQLQRPIERLDWVKGGHTVATRVRLAEGGQTLTSRGSWFRTRRRADRVTRLN